jgi:hypothetical protein
MFCPKCRYEYTQMVTVCPDCNEQLVTRLPDESNELDDGKSYDWVQIGRLTSDQYAEMVLEALHSKDIPAVILGGGGHFGQTGQMGPSSARPVGGGFSLMVPREFVTQANEEAQAILGDEWEQAKL